MVSTLQNVALPTRGDLHSEESGLDIPRISRHILAESDPLRSVVGSDCPELPSNESQLVITCMQSISQSFHRIIANRRLTDIRADHITVGIRQHPTKCYVLVQFDGTKRRTRNKPIGLEKATEWKELIPL